MTNPKSTSGVFIISLVLFASTHRLPAPIEEETPSPSPTSAMSTAPSASAVSKQEAARFAGTWTGRIKFGGNVSEVEYTLIINPEATSLIQKSQRFGEDARPTIVNAGTLSWTAGVRDGNLWTLTPSPDAQTAIVKVKPARGEEGTAIFSRSGEAPKRNVRGARAKERQ